jgi:hypothetical protein
MNERELTKDEKQVVADVVAAVDDMLNLLGERYAGTEYNLSALHMTVGAFLSFIENQCSTGVPPLMRSMWAERLISAAEMLLSQKDDEGTIH